MIAWRSNPRCDGLSMLLFVGACLLVARLLFGCSSTPAAVDKARAVAIVGGYEADLEPCRQAARDAGTIAAFDACEAKVTAELCARHPELAGKGVCRVAR